MSAILEIREVRQRVSRLSVEEYHRLDKFNNNGCRTELIRGVVIFQDHASSRDKWLAASTIQASSGSA